MSPLLLEVSWVQTQFSRYLDWYFEHTPQEKQYLSVKTVWPLLLLLWEFPGKANCCSVWLLFKLFHSALCKGKLQRYTGSCQNVLVTLSMIQFY